MVKRLIVFDFDGCLIDSPLPDEGKIKWSDFYQKEYPYVGWWSKKESLDLNVFDIKPLKSTYSEYLKQRSIPDTMIIIITSRLENLRKEVEHVLSKNNIIVDKIDMKRGNSDKGHRLLQYVGYYTSINEIIVYDDRDVELITYENIRPILTEKNINFIVNKVNNRENNLSKIINEEINDFICIYNKIINE